MGDATEGQKRFLADVERKRRSVPGLCDRIDNAIAAAEEGAPRGQVASLLRGIRNDLRATPPSGGDERAPFALPMRVHVTSKESAQVFDRDDDLVFVGSIAQAEWFALSSARSPQEGPRETPIGYLAIGRDESGGHRVVGSLSVQDDPTCFYLDNLAARYPDHTISVEPVGGSPRETDALRSALEAWRAIGEKINEIRAREAIPRSIDDLFLDDVLPLLSTAPRTESVTTNPDHKHFCTLCGFTPVACPHFPPRTEEASDGA